MSQLLRKRLLAMALALTLLASGAVPFSFPVRASAAVHYSYADIVNMMTDMERLALKPSGEKSGEASSYDRASRYDAATDAYIDWGANGDGGGIIADAGNPDGRGHRVLAADLTGPGVIWRTWSALANEGLIEIYIDGEAVPTVSRPFSQLFDGARESNAPFNYSALNYIAAQGRNCLVPITYNESCKIYLFDNWGSYYQFTYTAFPEGVTVEPMPHALTPSDREALGRVNAFFSALGASPAAARPEDVTRTGTYTVEAGASVAVLNQAGQGAVSAFKVQVNDVLGYDAMAEAIQELTVSMYWDGEEAPSVWAPLGSFFGTPFGDAYTTLPMGRKDGGYYCYFFMPFADGAKIVIGNDGQEARSVSVETTVTDLKGDAGNYLRFHAKWNKDDKQPARTDVWPDYTVLRTTGTGRFLGFMLHVYETGNYGWWGEGDEKFFVDGEKFPSSIGTGSEDYFSYAWCDPTLFTDKSFHAQPHNEGGVGNLGNKVVLRYQMTDNVPFTTSFDGYIEKYLNNNQAQYAVIPYWYLSVDGVDDYTPVSLAARTKFYKKPAFVQTYIEGESMTATVTGGPAPYNQTAMNGNAFSGGAQKLWINNGDGNEISLTFSLNNPTSGVFKIRPCMAGDFGIFQFYLDDQAIGDPVDLYYPRVIGGGYVVLGDVQLAAGAHVLKAKAVGKNPASSSYVFALDQIVITEGKSAPGLFEGEDLRVRSILPNPAGGVIGIQRMDGFSGSTWSRGEHLWWTGNNADSVLTLAFTLDEPVEAQNLSVAYTKAIDYGLFQLAVDGVDVGAVQNGYNNGVIASGPVPLGKVTLSAGSHTLTVAMKGKDSRSTNYMVGLDYIQFSKYDGYGLYLEDLTGVAGQAGTRFDIPVHLSGFPTGSQFRSVDGVLRIPDDFTVTDVVPSDWATFDDFDYFVDESGALRFAFTSLTGAPVSFDTLYTDEILTLRLALARTFHASAAVQVATESFVVRDRNDAVRYDVTDGVSTVRIDALSLAEGQAEIIRRAQENVGERLYSGDHLKKMEIPIGGLGTGAVYFDGNAVPIKWDCGLLGNDALAMDNSLFALAATVNGQKTTKKLRGGAVRGVDAMTHQPVSSVRSPFAKHGTYFVGTCEVYPAFTAFNDNLLGALRSDPFTLPADCERVTALVGGGSEIGLLYFALVDRASGTVIGKVTGSNSETMTDRSIDVPEAYRGREAEFHIVDNQTGGWGHINVDYIRFFAAGDTEISAPGFTNGDFEEGLAGWSVAANLTSSDVFQGVTLRSEYPFETFYFSEEGFPVSAAVEMSSPMVPVNEQDSSLPVIMYNVTLKNETDTQQTVSLLSSLANGVSGTNRVNTVTQNDGGTFIKLTSDRSDQSLYTGALGLWTNLTGGQVSYTAGAASVAALMAQQEAGALSGAVSANQANPVAGLSAPVTLAPGESRVLTFNWTWYFPFVKGSDIWGNQNVEVGKRYAHYYDSYEAVLADASARRGALYADTKRYHDAMYDTTLPYYLIDAVTSNSAILRSRTVNVLKNGDPYGWEGSDQLHSIDGMGNGNCMHVYNYAQAAANLFPFLARRYKLLDFKTQQRADGLLNNRIGEVPNVAPSGEGPAVDGVLGAIEGAYREHLNAADFSFLDDIWPHVKKAMDAVVTLWDVNEDGLIQNAAGVNTTFDDPIGGINTFTGAQYLAALRACEKMALLKDDAVSAARYRDIYTKGGVNLSRETFTGEYFRQVGANDYADGVMSDQLLGQSHAFLEQLGYVLPKDQVKTALTSIFHYNFYYPVGDRYRPSFDDALRILARPDDAALFNNTFPYGGAGTDPGRTLYLDETWPGFEYEVATAMLYTGLTEEAMAIVYAVRDRFDGEGYNAMSEREWGEYYTRSMASYGVLNAAIGLERDGPGRALGFKPNVTPAHIKGFFTYADGWGSFAQTRRVQGDMITQEDTVTAKYGAMAIGRLSFYVTENDDASIGDAEVRVLYNGAPLELEDISISGNRITLCLPDGFVLRQDEELVVSLSAFADGSNIGGWTDVAGAWSVGENGRTGAAAGGVRGLSLADRTARFFELRGTVTPHAGEAGLVFGAAAYAEDGAYAVVLDTAADRVKLIQFPDREWASAPYDLSAEETYAVRLEVTADKAAVFLADEKVLEVALTGYTAGLVGVYVSGGTGSFRDLLLRDRADTVIVDPARLFLAPGETAALTAYVGPDSALYREVEWSTSDASVVQVDPTGKLRAVGGGVAVVTATAMDGGYTASAPVAVHALGADGALSNLTKTDNGVWEDIPGGQRGTHSSDACMLGDERGCDFIYEGDLKITSSAGAAALVFRATDRPLTGGSYVVNIDSSAQVVKLFRFPYAVISQVGVAIDQNRTYHMKVVAIGNRFTVYFDDNPEPLISAIDNTYRSGRFGINIWNSTSEITNMRYTPILPLPVTNLTAAAEDGQYRLRWTDPPDGLFASVLIEDEEGRLLGQVNPGVQAFDVVLSEAARRTFYVYAADACGHRSPLTEATAAAAPRNALTIERSGDLAVVRGRVIGDGGDPREALLFLALYDARGRLTDVRQVEVTAAPGGDVSAQLELPLGAAAAAKGFLWDRATYGPLLPDVTLALT
ncbi:MAG: DUF2961 domain-containing protein [Oscillospiraceae bacterium]|jgi:uncharacterized protein (DUF608 family)|nr:DUF2961 domain-containing protein [Oscillospiraceae bacterium]